MLFTLFSFALLCDSFAVPLQVTQQGRVLDASGTALSGTQMVTFSIHDDLQAGTKIWEEALVVSFTNGYYAAVLGTDEISNPLDSTIFNQYPIYIEIQINTNAPMSPRQPINSAPFAQIAGVAESVDGGTVQASEVNTTEVQINASTVIDSTGAWVGQPITIDWTDIDQNTIPSYITDGDDNTQLSETQVETFITNGGIDLDASSTINGEVLIGTPTTCTAGQVLIYQGNNTWLCSDFSTMLDSDGDGVLAWEDCNDANSSIGSKTNDVDCDGIATADDCDDSDPTSTTVATDADCDGTLTGSDCDDNDAASTTTSNDADCDGFVTSDDCDDTNSNIFPFAGDTLSDSIDTDCDGMDCEAASDGSTYFAVCDELKTWSDARSACQTAGYSDLASILDSSENSFISNLVVVSDNPWIGFTDALSEGNFGWASGLGVSYTNWHPNEPNDSGGNEDCTQFYNPTSQSSSAAKWNDAQCSQTHTFICEKR